MARVLKASHSFTCTPGVHPLTEYTIPAFAERGEEKGKKGSKEMGESAPEINLWLPTCRHERFLRLEILHEKRKGYDIKYAASPRTPLVILISKAGQLDVQNRSSPTGGSAAAATISRVGI